MRPSRVLVVAAALILGAALTALPALRASAQSPSTEVVVPSSGATVAGTRVILDAGASAGVTQVKFELTAAQLVYAVLFAAPTYYGWITLWNSTTLRDGTYTLTSIATEGGSSAASPGISITVSNGSPSVSIVVPSSGATVSGKHAVLDAVASPGVSQVTFDLIATGCPNVSTIFPPIYICAIGGVPTIYGWIGTFDSTDWANGSYPLFTIAAYPSGQGSAGPEAMSTVDVDNQAQPTVVVRRTTPPCPALRCSTAPHRLARGLPSRSICRETQQSWVWPRSPTTAGYTSGTQRVCDQWAIFPQLQCHLHLWRGRQGPGYLDHCVELTFLEHSRKNMMWRVRGRPCQSVLKPNPENVKARLAHPYAT